MGYNGLGLQKWIYTQKARRPFTKDRKPSGNFTDYHHDNGYVEKVLSSTGKKRKITQKDSDRASRRLDEKLRDLKHFLIIKRIIVGVLILFGISLLIYSYVESKKPKDRNDHIKKSMAISHCERAKDYFDKGKFYLAHDYFMKAVQIDPDCFEAYHGLVLVYSNQCGVKDNHCVNALKLIEKMRKKFSNRDLSDLRVIEQICRENLGIDQL